MLGPEDLERLGCPPGRPTELAGMVVAALVGEGLSLKRAKRKLAAVLNRPRQYLDHELFGELARCLVEDAPDRGAALRAEMVPHRIWGRDLLDEGTLRQFSTACRLPVAVRGAQMPDGHVGYGLPIGGVLATRDAVIPYAVGVDIACRMRLSVYEDGVDLLAEQRERLRRALIGQTRFGVGAAFDAGARRRHAVMDEPVWSADPLLRELKDKAWAQLGTSGSGNHFVEFGELVCEAGIPEIGLPPGTYLALLSHSGSRGLGFAIANHYTRVAMSRCRLPQEARHLAWLDLDSADGQGYWQAMELAGRYASANHELVHRHVTTAAGLTVIGHVENHHNFAWREEHGGETVIVHRKGATPAARGVLGVIPGSMGDPGYVVRGLGHPESLNSSAHGAGRVMSRKQAVKSLSRAQQRAYLEARGIELIAAGLDESPHVYKRIGEVMAAQNDLVEVVAEFRPRLVLMAAGGPAED